MRPLFSFLALQEPDRIDVDFDAHGGGRFDRCDPVLYQLRQVYAAISAHKEAPAKEPAQAVEWSGGRAEEPDGVMG